MDFGVVGGEEDGEGGARRVAAGPVTKNLLASLIAAPMRRSARTLVQGTVRSERGIVCRKFCHQDRPVFTSVKVVREEFSPRERVGEGLVSRKTSFFGISTPV